MSAIHQQLHNRIDELPGQVLDFLEFLKQRQPEPTNTLPVPPAPYESWLKYRMDQPYMVESEWRPFSREEANER